ncbi:MAG TPA: Flp family type IVb pilin [Acetobacteraceae bacterium]|jgi:Flp pilus assembly pilin Flp|nr:Flp family type IVb pilin [Acetobacteraceae bacterium]HUB46265.1 Flp family type IVb pilin [Acetobacteraceae bacterium]
MPMAGAAPAVPRHPLLIGNYQQNREQYVVPPLFHAPEAKPCHYVFRGSLRGRILQGAGGGRAGRQVVFDPTPKRSSPMVRWRSGWLRLSVDKRGVTALEYGLIAAAITAVIVTTVISFGNAVEVELYQNVAANL